MQSNVVGREGTSIVQIGNGGIIICIDFLRMMSHDSMCIVCVCACMCIVCCVCMHVCCVCVHACAVCVCANEQSNSTATTFDGKTNNKL